jgi:predicted glycosyltransferase
LKADFGKKHCRIASYKELAYLHPNYYTPNEDVYRYLGINKGDRYAILRFNAFDAVHDFKKKGFSDEEKIILTKKLSDKMHVFISEENSNNVSGELSKYILNIPYNLIHDVLFYASIFVCDSQTMATEAAILGTPTIRCNTFVGNRDMSNFIELEKNYNLLYNYNDSKIAINKAIELANDSMIKEVWQKNKESLLKEKVDIVEYFVNILINNS